MALMMRSSLNKALVARPAPRAARVVPRAADKDAAPAPSTASS